jgi:hypothetical protein
MEELMQHRHVVGSVVLWGCIAAAAAGCRSKEPAAPPAEDRTQAAQTANHPETVTGCLKAGDAPNTFVVTAAKTEGSAQTATYQLVSNAGVNLADHVGRQVEVSGTVKQTQELQSRDRAQPAQPAGTSGQASKPVVETRTEVDIKQIEPVSIKRVGDRCE